MGISVAYGDGRSRNVRVLEDVSLEFDPCVTAIVGPSGSGKTTLLRVLAGVQKPDQGQLLHELVDVAMTFQEARLVPFLTSRENVLLGAELAVAGLP